MGSIRHPTTASPVVPFRAFVTDDAEQILRFALDGFERCAASALVTLVNVRGGAARSPGAQMAVHGDGAFCGFVSGGCTEAAVAAEALAAMAIGEDRFLHLGEGSKFFDIVLPCGGAITLFIHVVRDAGPLVAVLHALSGRAPVMLAIDTCQQLIAVPDGIPATGWSDDIFRRMFWPRTRLIVCGRGIESDITARLGETAGFEVIAPETPAAFNEASIDPYTAVVLLYHDVDYELPILRAALDRMPFYIGALGSSKTHSKRLEALQAGGYGEDVANRIHAPIGLVKAKDAQTLGLSILAEIAASRI